MLTLSMPAVFSPEVALDPEVAVGQAFQRVCHERSRASRLQLRHALTALVEVYHDEPKTPESAVIAFKKAVRQFGGLHEDPGLALDYHADGDECASVYSQAFAQFVEIYFLAGRSR